MLSFAPNMPSRLAAKASDCDHERPKLDSKDLGSQAAKRMKISSNLVTSKEANWAAKLGS